MFKAIFESEKPGHFAGWLLQALKERRLPDAVPNARRAGSPEEFDKMFGEVGRGDYHYLALINEADPRRMLYLKIGCVSFRGRHAETSAPAIVLGNNRMIKLDVADYHEAAEKTGVRKFEGGTHETEDLLIPKKLLEHWSEKITSETKTKDGGSTNILLNQYAFEGLEKHYKKEQFLGRYLETLNYLARKRNEGRYAAFMRLEGRYPRLSTYQAFHLLLETKLRRFFQRVVEAKTREELAQLIVRTLNVSGPFANEYADRIADTVSTSESFWAAARWMAEDAEIRPEEIRRDPWIRRPRKQ